MYLIGGGGWNFHPLFLFSMKGDRLISEAISGRDFITVVVNGKSYKVNSPTIYKLSGASSYLSSFGDEKTIVDILKNIGESRKLACSLSWMINGDDSLADELSHGTFDELVNALCESFELISVQNFLMLSSLAKNVGRMIAKSK